MTGRTTTSVLGLTAAFLLVVSAAACSMDIGGIEFHVEGPSELTNPQGQAPVPFTATGQPVDSDSMCDRGTATIVRFESTDGEVLTIEAWVAMFDTAMKDKGTAEVYAFQELECQDGSGSFVMKVHNRFDFSDFDFEGEHDVGRWEVEAGTGAYSDLSGSGDVTFDWDGDEVKYDGDVR